MGRRYDSSKRKKGAEQTRQDILQAALKLHWQGITEFGPLAAAAGCSEATLRKHFPTKESLYQGCTRTFAETLQLPDLEALSKIAEPGRRLQESVTELCRIHEAMFGYAWLGAKLRQDSAILNQEMIAYEQLIDAVAGLIVPADSTDATLVRGLLDFLCYRALRRSAGMTPKGARQGLIALLIPNCKQATNANNHNGEQQP
jgi:AcrR family transcriptional regulator